MAQKRNQLIVAELDLMAASLEAKGNADLASLIDEVSAELLNESTVVEAKAPKAKKAPKPAKSNNKRRKTNKKKASASKVVISRADAKKILKAAHSELLDIASELLKDGDLKEARHIIRYAEEVKEEENKLLVTDMPEGEVPAPMAEDTEESDDEDLDDDMDDSEEESDDEESEEDDLDDSEDDSDEEDYEEDEDIEAMLRKYELGDDSPAAPEVKTETPTAPATPEESEECEDEEDDSEEDSEEESEDEDEDEESEEDSEEEPKKEDNKEDKKEDKTEKDAKVKLFSLAKKLAAAGETKLAYDIADLLDRKN